MEEKKDLAVPQKKASKIISGVPEEYYQNELLNEAIALLPAHYNFEIQKTIYRIDSLKK